MPVIMLICFWEGFSEVLKKAGVKYTVTETQPKTLGTNENVLRFKNCWITYEETVGQSLLLNGLRIIDTTQYDLSEMDTMEPYVRYFEKIFGKATIGNALQNFYEFSDIVSISRFEYRTHTRFCIKCNKTDFVDNWSLCTTSM